MPKKIDPEYRARAVRLVLERQEEYATVTEAMVAVSKQLGVSRESVRRWVAQADIDAGRRQGSLPGARRDQAVEGREPPVARGRGRAESGDDFLRVNGTLRGSGRVRSFFRCCDGPGRWLLVRCAARPDALAFGRGVA